MLELIVWSFQFLLEFGGEGREQDVVIKFMATHIETIHKHKHTNKTIPCRNCSKKTEFKNEQYVCSNNLNLH